MNGALQRRGEAAAGALIGAVAFLLPLKFGALAMMPEATPFYPDSPWGYAVINWPGTWFGLFSGIALLAALAAFPAAPGEFRTPAGRTALLWGAALPLVSLIGWIHARTLDYAVSETGHLAAVGAYVFAVRLMLARRPEWRSCWIAALAAGTLLTAAAGLHQYFFGFEETRAFVARQKAEGIPIHPVLEAKIADTRVFSTFISCNALAGFLLLMMPVVLLVCRRCGRHFVPEKLSMRLFTAIGAALMIPVFLLTKSRGAFLAAAATLAVCVCFLPMRRWRRSALIVCAAAAVAVGALYIHRAGRGFGSMTERVDYLRTTAVMTAERPLTGYGWGGFFYRHMREKRTTTDEAAHDPHNLFASFASQTGLIGLAAMLAAVLLPMAELGRRMLRRGASAGECAIFWGEFGFFLHAMMDVDLQVAADMASAGALLVAALSREAEPASSASAFRRLASAAVPLASALAAIGFSVHLTRAEVRFDALLTLIGGAPDAPAEARRPATGDQVYEALRRAAEAKPYSPFPWENAATFYLMRGDAPAAERMLREAETRGGERASIHYRFCRAALLRGDVAAARAHWRRVHELFPGASYRKELREREPGVLLLLD